MEELISTKKHFSKLGWFYLTATGIILAVQLLMSLLINLFCPRILENMNINILLGMVPMYLAGFPLLVLMLNKQVPAQKPERHKMTAGQYILSAIICLGLAYAANIAGNILTTFIGLITGKPVENEILSVVDSLHPAVILLYMVICAPIVEEFIFRKLIVDRALRAGSCRSAVRADVWSVSRKPEPVCLCGGYRHVFGFPVCEDGKFEDYRFPAHAV